ncbi:hypothetical protein ACFP2T_37650 [Plantactinospora solaniradicis]|uniref:Uncharacterized protein n=1 Tax=Plantactinospora solaniradicis TaxID=1723736 RepID=A0ABW1KK59_9ACTN
MARKGRRRIVGKWATIEQAYREKELRALLLDLRREWTRRKNEKKKR